MKKNLPDKALMLKAVLLTEIFPDVFQGVKELLLKEYPYLKIPCLQEELARKTVFYILYSVASSNERDWDEKIENGLDVSTCISFESLRDSSEVDWFEDVRNNTNYSYLKKIIHRDAVIAFSQSTTLHKPK